MTTSVLGIVLSIVNVSASPGSSTSSMQTVVVPSSLSVTSPLYGGFSSEECQPAGMLISHSV